MDTRTDALAQALLHAGLHRVINRGSGISTQANRTSKRIGSNGWIQRRRRVVSEAHRIAVDAFEKSAAFRADIPNTEHEIARNFALQFKAEGIVNRRMEIRRNLRSREDCRVYRQRLERCKSVRNVCQVERRYKRERAPNVERDVGIGIVVGAGLATADDEFVTTGEETHDAVVARVWVPIEPKTRLKII